MTITIKEAEKRDKDNKKQNKTYRRKIHNIC